MFNHLIKLFVPLIKSVMGINPHESSKEKEDSKKEDLLMKFYFSNIVVERTTCAVKLVEAGVFDYVLIPVPDNDVKDMIELYKCRNPTYKYTIYLAVSKDRKPYLLAKSGGLMNEWTLTEGKENTYVFKYKSVENATEQISSILGTEAENAALKLIEEKDLQN